MRRTPCSAFALSLLAVGGASHSGAAAAEPSLRGTRTAPSLPPLSSAGEEPRRGRRSMQQEQAQPPPQLGGPGVFLVEFLHVGGRATGFSCEVISQMASPGQPLGNVTCSLDPTGGYGIIKFENVTSTPSLEVGEYLQDGLRPLETWLVGSPGYSITSGRTAVDYGAFLNISIEGTTVTPSLMIENFRIGYSSSSPMGWYIGGKEAEYYHASRPDQPSNYPAMLYLWSWEASNVYFKQCKSIHGSCVMLESQMYEDDDMIAP